VSWKGADSVAIETHGMTLRDYFAGQALVGILGSGDAKIDNIISDEFASATLAQSTYIIADAMLAARERKEDAP
jgi:hypothetical protein